MLVLGTNLGSLFNFAICSTTASNFLLCTFVQPLYENRNAEEEDDWDTNMRALQKEQETYIEPFPDLDNSDSERYVSLDTVARYKELGEEDQSVLCE